MYNIHTQCLVCIKMSRWNYIGSVIHWYCMRLDVVLLFSNTVLQHATLIVPFTCVGIDYAGGHVERQKNYDTGVDWRQLEDVFDRIRNCGESGEHTESDAYSICGSRG